MSGGIYSGVGTGVILAKVAGSTRTQADYTPAAAGGVVAMTSDLDVVITPPSGTSKVLLNWDMFGEAAATSRTGFLVYRDVAGGGYVMLPNCRTGTDYWECICTPTYDTDANTTASVTAISILDDVPVIGSVATYRVYTVGTASSGTELFSLNATITTPSASTESGITTFSGECL